MCAHHPDPVAGGAGVTQHPTSPHLHLSRDCSFGFSEVQSRCVHLCEESPASPHLSGVGAASGETQVWALFDLEGYGWFCQAPVHKCRLPALNHTQLASSLVDLADPTAPSLDPKMGCTTNKRLHHQLPQVQTGLTPVTKPINSSSASWSNLDWYTHSMRYENHSKTEILSVLTRKSILQNAYQFSSVQSLSRVRFFPTPLIATCQASLSITNSGSLPKLMSIELVMPSNHLILCRPLLLLPSIFPSIRVFSMSQFFLSGGQSIGVSASASVLSMNIQDWFPLGWLVWSPCSLRDSQESSPTPQFKSINSSMLSFLYSPTLTSIHDYWENHSLD